MTSEEALHELLEGNRRFAEGIPVSRRVGPEERAEFARGQHPFALIIGCVDSRVTPDVIFDQPLGKLMVCRVPGNTPSDSAKWTLEIAVGELHVPLVLVVGHTQCVAVGQILEGRAIGPGGPLRIMIASAVMEARSRSDSASLYRNAVIANALQTTRALSSESWSLREAVRAGQCVIRTAIYELESGRVELLD